MIRIYRKLRSRLYCELKAVLRVSKGYSYKPKVDFLIIGSAKCGTTSLHKYLNAHPNIFLPEECGINNETGLFLSDSDESLKSLSNRKIRNYLGDHHLHLRVMRDYRGEKIIGEETTDYTKFPHRTVEMDRIFSVNPQMKFIYIVRDPIEKLVSQHNHYLKGRKSREVTSESIAEEIANDEYYLNSIRYAEQLKPYVEKFGKESIKVILLEDLKEAPLTIMKELFSFLGADDVDLDPGTFKTYNKNKIAAEKKPSKIPIKVSDEIRNSVVDIEKFTGKKLLKKWPTTLNYLTQSEQED